ncbi:uncharacterized protein BXZ73DRAFT_106251 [Epithele typhae]|uniref:uncharacterized protein n=1 Tax=Epithele typhae TaxID=378194 RepID=UPI0020073C90|nr:uncharacterized protein BXZ73DRAFT_106251 [Epithele typhae]KAH9915279.1 hypothetical protein BXZ73DRAFT_106251 [Epithele typhae]
MTVAVPFLSSSIPAADHTALDSLSDDAVRAWVLIRAQEYRDIALALLSIYNAVAPIHRAFPTETPRLWAAALAAPGKLLSQYQGCRSSRGDFAAFALERSSPQPLRLKLYDFPDHIGHTLVPHAVRLVDLYVRLDDPSTLCSLLSQLLNSERQSRTLPRLHTLRCIPIDLFPHFTTPTLRDVCVTPAQFAYDHLANFARALTRCPALERLKFWIVGGELERGCDNDGQEIDGGPIESYLPDFGSPIWNSVDPVTLPALQNVVINTGLYPVSHRYLRCLSFPLSTTIENADMAQICDSDSSSGWKATELTTFKDGIALTRLALSTSEWAGAAPDGRRIPRNEDLYFDTREVLRALPNLTSLDIAGQCVSNVLRALLDGKPSTGGRRTSRSAVSASAYPCRRIPSSARLRSKGGRSEPSGMGGDDRDEIQNDFGELVKMLSSRASSGLRLQRLEWRVAEWDDELRLEFPPTALVSTYVPPPTAPYDPTELEMLVDGPVVFGGVTYQARLP